MLLKFLKDEDFVNYKKCSMFLGTSACTWKCCKEAGISCEICQNYPWSHEPAKEIPNETIIKRYLNNSLTEAIVIGGLEPFDTFETMFNFINEFRKQSNDDIVIYTGYEKNEITYQLAKLKVFKNIIIKFGRYVPNRPAIHDEVLGIDLVSDNQHAEKL